MLKKMVARFTNRAELVKAYSREGPLGGVFVPGKFGLRTGEVVLLEILLEEERETLRTAGIVRWKRVKSSPRLAGGVGITFAPDIPLTPGDKPLIEKIPEAVAEMRRGSRYLVSLEAAYRVLGITLHRTLDDLSRTGGFLETDVPPSVGMVFPVTISQGGGSTVDLTVASVRREMKRDGRQVRGVGFEFVIHTPREQQYISRIMANVAIRHLEERDRG